MTPLAPAARVLIVAGEASGDLHAGRLMEALSAVASAKGSGVGFSGIGGPCMRAAGLRSVAGAEGLGVTGVVEVLGSLGRIWAAFRSVTAPLADPSTRPDLVILVDYPDFNLMVARRARRAGVPVLYFISPQVWAWRRGRVRRIAGLVDRMLVILPFEEEIYRRAGVPVEFVGHPLLDVVGADRTRDQALRPIGLDSRRPLIALLPGSRRNEVAEHLPVMLAALRRLRREFRDLQSVVPVAPTLDRAFFEEAMKRDGGRDAEPPVLVEEGRYDVLAAADAAAVASGTATLEAALLGVPMVVVYRMHPLTYMLARALSRVPHIGMPNLIAEERVVPELVQDHCREDLLAGELRRLLTNPAAVAEMRRSLIKVRGRLGSPGAAGRAAAAAWDMIAAGRAAGRP